MRYGGNRDLQTPRRRRPSPITAGVLLFSLCFACSLELPERTCQTSQECGAYMFCNEDGLCESGVPQDSTPLDIFQPVDANTEVSDASCGTPGRYCDGFAVMECLENGSTTVVQQCDPVLWQRCLQGEDECDHRPDGYGTTCSQPTDCAETLTCTERGLCLTDEPGETGHPCWDDRECVTGLVCHEPGFTCQVGNIGDPCTRADHCQFELVCSGDRENPGGCSLGALGDDCSTADNCFGELVCGPDGCQGGFEGDPCENPSHCSESASICHYRSSTCQNGEWGDPCDGNDECSDDYVCGPVDPYQETAYCQAGREGNPCSREEHCSVSASNCVGGFCFDGSEGDPCAGDADNCSPDLYCGALEFCQIGSEGDPCSDSEQCSPQAPICSTFGICQDGMAPDVCWSDDDCRTGCTPEGMCSNREPFAQSRDIVLFEPCTELTPTECDTEVFANAGGASSWRRTDEPVEIPLVNGVIDRSVYGYWPFDETWVEEVYDSDVIYTHDRSTFELPTWIHDSDTVARATGAFGDPDGAFRMENGLWVETRFWDENSLLMPSYTLQFWYQSLEPTFDTGTFIELTDGLDPLTTLYVRVVSGQLVFSQDRDRLDEVETVDTFWDEEWHLFTVVVDTQTGLFPLVYIDGGLVEVDTGPTWYPTPLRVDEANFGRFRAGDDEGFAFAMDDVVLVARALSPTEIRAYFNSGQPFGTSLVPLDSETPADFDDVRVTDATVPEEEQRITHEIIGARPHSDVELDDVEAYWPLEMGPAELNVHINPEDMDLSDIVGGRDGVFDGSANTEVGPFGPTERAIWLNEDNEEPIETDYGPVLGPSDPLTIEAWVRLSDPTPILGFDDETAGTLRLDLVKDAYEICRITLEIGHSTTQVRQSDSRFDYCDRQWHHVAIVGRDQTSVELYVDGAAHAGVYVAHDPINASGSTAMHLAGVNLGDGTATPMTSGSIAEVIVHGVDRSADYIFHRSNPRIPMVRFLASTEEDENTDNRYNYRHYRLYWDSPTANSSPAMVAAPDGDLCEGLLSPCNGYMGWWRFEDESPFLALDSSTNQMKGHFGDLARSVPGPEGRAVVLSRPFLVEYNFGSETDPRNLEQFTIEAGVNPAASADIQRIVHRGDVSGLAGSNYYCYLDVSYRVHCGYNDDHDEVSSVALATDSWEILAAVFDGTEMTLFRQYTDFSAGDFAFSSAPPASDDDIHIGGIDSGESGTSLFTGSIDYIRVMNRPLETHELLHLPLTQFSLGEVVEGETWLPVVGRVGDVCEGDLDCRTLNCQDERCTE